MMMRWSFHIKIQIILNVMGRSINQGQCYPSLCARVPRVAPPVRRRTLRAVAVSFHAFHQSLPRYEDQSIPEYIPLWVHCIQQHLRDRSNLWEKRFKYRVLFTHERVCMSQGRSTLKVHSHQAKSKVFFEFCYFFFDLFSLFFDLFRFRLMIMCPT